MSDNSRDPFSFVYARSFTELFSVPMVIEQFSWEWVCGKFPFLRDLDACPQDATHHAEGNVGIHTRMVIEELLCDPDYMRLDATDQFIMFWSAVFHDSGKPATTVHEDDGRITSRGHSKVGALIARDALRQAQVPFPLREEICGIIMNHQQPFWLYEHEEGEQTRKAIKTSMMCRPELLLLHAKADAKGRECADKAQLLTNVELSRLIYEELGILDKAYEFANEESKVAYFDVADRALNYVAHEDYRCRVTVMSGLPGSGKDTWIAAHMGDRPVVSLDALREEMKIDAEGNQGSVIQAAYERAREYLRKGQDFVWNGTNVTADMRGKIIRLLRDYNAHITIAYIEPTPKTLLSQNGSRKASVPVTVIERLAKKLSPPTPWEAHRVIHVLPNELQFRITTDDWMKSGPKF